MCNISVRNLLGLSRLTIESLLDGTQNQMLLTIEGLTDPPIATTFTIILDITRTLYV